jgi:pimeloyl-ACP methyl ester carboxylesterase
VNGVERVKVRGVHLAIRTSGHGPGFIWGHGLLTSMAQEDDVDLFDWSKSDGHVRWIRYDARGHGASEATYDPADYQWPALARDLLELATALGERRPILGGVSMGCATAIHAAHAEPQRAAGLLLVGPPTGWEKRPRQSLIYRVTSGIVSYTGLGPLRLLSRLPLLGASDSVVARVQRALVHHLARADARAVAAALAGAAQSDLPAPADLTRLDVPALILAWRGDPVHPVSTAQRLAELMPNAELTVARSVSDVRAWPDQVRAFFEKMHQPSVAI